MILVDTSAWIDFFRGSGKLANEVSDLIDGDLATICGPIVTEIYRGTVRAKERQSLEALLKGIPLLQQPETLWEDAGLLGAFIAKKGFTVKSFDLLIASYAIAADIALLTADRDFNQMRKVGVPLRLYTGHRV